MQNLNLSSLQFASFCAIIYSNTQKGFFASMLDNFTQAPKIPCICKGLTSPTLRNNLKPLPGIGQSREVCLEGVASQVLGRVLKPSCSRRNDYFNVEDIVEIVLKPSCRNDYLNVEDIVEILLKPGCRSTNDHFEVNML